MSRSSPTITNPAVHFFEWSGSRGEISYYDREKKENIPVKLPFEFLVLDELSTITGWSDQDQSSYWSNEVRSVGKDELTVRTKHGIKVTGNYQKDIKGRYGKYTKSIYIAYKEAGEYVICNLKASGAALNAWIDFSSNYRVQNGKVTITGGREEKKGATVFQVPVFEYSEASKEEDDIAVALDKQLQEFLAQYLVTPQEDDSVPTGDIDPELGKATPEQLADFERRKKEKLSQPLQADDYDDAEAQSLYNSVAGAETVDESDVPPEYR